MIPLPIFHFPQLVFVKIINSMNLAEQFLTALCSRKAFVLVKSNRNKAIKLTLSTTQYRCCLWDEQQRIEKRLQLNIRDNCYGESQKSIDINENRGLQFWIDNREGCDDIFTCWENRSLGIRNMFQLAADLFRVVQIDSVHITGHEDIWIVDWLKEHQITLKRLNFYDWNRSITDYDIKHVILGGIAQQFYMEVRPSDNFGSLKVLKSFDLFSCPYGYWITIDNLIALDCIELRIYHKYFMCYELNQFLKHWINDGSSRLKFLRVTVEEFNQNEIFADIQNHVTRIPGDRVYTSPYNTTWTFNGMQLQRNDGVRASIQYVPNFGILYFGVWPDANGNA